MLNLNENEKGAVILPDDSAPNAVEDSTPHMSIVPQESIENQDVADNMSNNTTENADATGMPAGGTDTGKPNVTVNVVPMPAPQAKPKNYEANVREMTNYIVDDYIRKNGPFTVQQLLADGAKISDDLLSVIQNELCTRNGLVRATDKTAKLYPVPNMLPPSVAVKLILSTGAVRVMKLNADHYRIIVKHYNEDGSFSGIWELIPDINKEGFYGVLNTFVNELIGGDAPMHVMAQTVNALRSELTNDQKNKNFLVEVGWDPDLVPFYNGVYNGREKTFMEYTDPMYESTYGHIYWLNKMDTCFRWFPAPLADFDPVTFIRSLFEDTPEGNASYQLVMIFAQFMLRRYLGLEGYLMNFINKSGVADGKNGKSTLADMLVGMISHSANEAYSRRKDKKVFFQNGHKVEKVPIDKWGKEFQLASNIMCAWILFSDEVSGKKVVEETGFLKNICRHQSVQLRPMFHEPFSYVFDGTLLHLQNEETMLATKDGASFTHRIDLAFEKDFSGAKGDPRIKTYFTACEETWEYLASYLMTQMEWYEDYPKELLALVEHNTEDIREANIPALQFLNEVMDGLKECATIPTPVLFELYRNWAVDNGFDYKVTEMTLSKFEANLQMWIRKHRTEYDYVEGRRKLNCKAEYDVIDYETGKIIQVSEIGLLTHRLHPAIKQYGLNRKGEKPKYIHVAYTLKGPVLGVCDLLAVSVRFRHFVEVKNRIIGYEETTSGKQTREDSRSAYLDLGRSQSNVVVEATRQAEAKRIELVSNNAETDQDADAS